MVLVNVACQFPVDLPLPRASHRKHLISFRADQLSLLCFTVLMVSSKHAGKGTVSTYVPFVLYMNMLLHANCSFFHLPTYYFFLWPHSIPPLPAQDHRAVSLLWMASAPIHRDSIVYTITPVYLSLYPNNLTIWSTKSTFLPLSSSSLHGVFYVRYTRTAYRKSLGTL